MTREEAVKLLQATRLMLMDGANQPISDLYYALDMAIEALEQTEPQTEVIACPIIDDDAWIYKDEPQTDMAEDIVRSFGFKVESYRQAKAKDEPQTEREGE